MIKWASMLLFGLVGLINFAPIMGVMGVERLSVLYGVDITSPDLALLMRHRAVLFGIIGGYILVSAIRPAHRELASLFGFISMVSYMALYLLTDGTNSAIERVFQIDCGAVVLLVIAFLLNKKLAPVSPT